MTTRSKLSCRTSPCQARPDTVWRAQAGVDYVQRFPEPGRNTLAGKDLLSVKEALRNLKPTLPAEVGWLISNNCLCLRSRVFTDRYRVFSMYVWKVGCGCWYQHLA